jgi:hypothetical protein
VKRCAKKPAFRAILRTYQVFGKPQASIEKLLHRNPLGTSAAFFMSAGGRQSSD